MDSKLTKNLDDFSERLYSILENSRNTYNQKKESIDNLIAQITINLEKLKNVSASLSDKNGILKLFVIEVILEMRLAEKKLSDNTVSPELKICTEWLEQLVYNSEPVSEIELQFCVDAVGSRTTKIGVLLTEEEAYSKALESAEGVLSSFKVWNETAKRNRK